MIQDLFEKMFQYNPAERIGIEQIAKHEWFDDMHDHSATQVELGYKNELHSSYYENIGAAGTSQARSDKIQHNMGGKLCETSMLTLKNGLVSNIISSSNNGGVKMNIRYSNTGPENESGLDISTFSDFDDIFENDN